MTEECYWYEAIVVDSEMPFDRQHESEEVYEVAAASEAHARLAITLVVGDRYEVVEFTADQPVETDDPYDEFETDLTGYLDTIYAFEVVDLVTVRVRFRADDEWHEKTTKTLPAAVRWYHNHDLSNPDGDYPEKTTATYQASSEVAYDSILQRLPERHVTEYIKETTDTLLNA